MWCDGPERAYRKIRLSVMVGVWTRDVTRLSESGVGRGWQVQPSSFGDHADSMVMGGDKCIMLRD